MRFLRVAFVITLLLIVAGVFYTVRVPRTEHALPAVAAKNVPSPGLRERTTEKEGATASLTPQNASAVNPADVPIIGTGSSIGTLSAFAALEVAADAGQREAMRQLAQFGRECQDVLYVTATSKQLPIVRTEGAPVSARDELALNNELSRRASVCGEIGEDRARSAYNRMLDAALAGDEFAQMNLRHYPPRMGPDTPYRVDEWRVAVMASLESRGDDPRALYELAEVHLTGVAGTADLPQALALLERVLQVAPPDSAIYRRAARRLERLRG